MLLNKLLVHQLLKTRLLTSNLTGKWFIWAFRFPLVSYYQHYYIAVGIYSIQKPNIFGKVLALIYFALLNSLHTKFILTMDIHTHNMAMGNLNKSR